MSKLSYDVLKIRDFRLLLCTQSCTAMALQAQAVIVGWQIWQLTHNLFLLGLVGLIEAVPAITSALFSGHVVDTRRPHGVYLVCLAVLALNTLVLLTVAGGHATPPFADVLHWIYAGVFISGVVRSFAMPSAFALLAQIVPKDKMAAAAGWRSSVLQFSFVAGPAAAGLIYGGYGVGVAWMFPTALLCVATFIIMALSEHPRRFKNPKRAETATQSIKAGWKFIWGNNVLLSVMALDMFAVLLGGVVAVLPAFADQVLKTTPEGLGLLRAAPAIGSILTALVLALYPMKIIRTALLLWVVAGFGVSMICIGLSTTFAMAAFFLALSGAFDSVSVVIRSTLMQWLTPDAMRGRISAVSSMFIISSNEIGAFRAGGMAQLLGIIPSILFGGVGTLVVVAAILWLCPQLRTIVIDADGKKSG